MYDCTRALCPLCEKRVAVNPTTNSLRKHRVSHTRGVPICAGSNMIVFTPTEQRFAMSEGEVRSFTIEKDNMPLFTTTNQHLATEVTRLIKGACVTMQSIEEVLYSHEVKESCPIKIEWFAIPEVVTQHLTKGEGVWSTVPQYRASCAPDLIAIPCGGSNHSRYLAALTLTLDTVSGNDAVRGEVERALEYMQSSQKSPRIMIPSTAISIASIIRASLKVQDAQDGRGRIALWSLLSQSNIPALEDALVYGESPTRFLLETLNNASTELLAGDIRPDNLRTETQRVSNLLDEVAARLTIK